MDKLLPPLQCEYRELLLGCGHSREKRIHPVLIDGLPARMWEHLVTLDIDPACNPDIVFDLHRLHLETNRIPSMNGDITPHSWYDEIHAYEVLEHVGLQGDYVSLFAEFCEFWRILKPGGYFCATVPDWKSIWAWGDPGHSRVINKATLVFLSKAQYEHQVGRTAMSDYRSLTGEMDFELVRAKTIGEQFEFVLMAIK